MNGNTKTLAPESTRSSGLAESSDSQNVLGQYIPLIYHYNMLQDDARVEAFRQAIELVVRPGMHVVELGGGTGILSSFAARRGARVTCVERNPELVATAREFLSANGLADKVKVIHADATDFVPESPADVVVCEMLHVALLREKQASVIDAFKRNYRSRFASRPSQRTRLPIFIPEASILMVQPIEQDFEFAGYHAPVPMFQAATSVQPRTIELANLHPYASIAYNASIPQRLNVSAHFACDRAGYFNAIRLVTQNVLAIDEAEQSAITWPNQCLVLPIEHPVELRDGHSLSICFDYETGGSIEDLRRSLGISFTEIANIQ